MLEIYIFYISLIARLYSFLYSYFYYNLINPSQKKIKYLNLLVPFTRYTDLSQFLSIIWASHIYLFNLNPSSSLTCTTWSILCNVSVGYWLFKGNIINKDIDSDKLYYILFEYIAHGVIPLIMLFELVNYPFYLPDLIYPIILSGFWLIGIMVPWYKFTNEPVYPFLHKSVSIMVKIKIIGFIFLNTILSGLIGSFISQSIMSSPILS